MSKASLWQRVRSSLQASAGEVVFGMEDSTVSIFGLVFGVAATTTDQKAVLIAGAEFLAAAIPILPFGFLAVPQGRVVSATVTTLLLVALGVGRPRSAAALWSAP